MAAAEGKEGAYAPITMKRIFTLPDGRSAHGTVTVPLGIDLGDIGTMSDWVPSAQFKFRVTPGTYDFDTHRAPREQVIVNLDASVECITDRDGARTIGIGELLFVEDTTGNGHKSRAVDGKERHSLFIECSRAALENVGCVFHDEAYEA